MKSRISSFVALISFISVLLTTTTPALATSSISFLGVNGGPIDGNASQYYYDGNLDRNGPLRAKSFFWAQEVGFNWFREYSSDGISYSWRFVEPTQGNFDFSVWDLLVQKAQEKNVNILAEIGNSVPWWANGSDNWRDPPPDLYNGTPMEKTGWYKFVKTMVERYDGDGFGDMPWLTKPIKYWEIWNEPDLKDEHGNAEQFNGTVTDYVKLLEVAYAAVKAADPTATVVGPATAQNPTNTSTSWVLWTWDDFRNANGLNFVDVVSFHTYYPNGYNWDSQGTIDNMLNITDTKRGGKQVWLTEMGWDNSLDATSKASNFVRSVIILWNRNFLDHYFWYSFHESETFPGRIFSFIQTLNDTPAVGTEPDPLFQPINTASSVMTRLLQTYDVSDRPQVLDVGPEARAYKFGNHDPQIWVAWKKSANDSTTINIDTGGLITRVVGMYGEDLGTFSGGNLTVYPTPIYLTTDLNWNPNVTRITGRLKDGNNPNSWNNGIVGATVKLTGQFVLTTTTDSDGNYVFRDLPVGTYEISVPKRFAIPGVQTVTTSLQNNWGRTSFQVY